MINLKSLKLDKIRKTFMTEINGEMKEIVIFNLLDEERENFKNKIKELNKSGLKGRDLVEEIFTDVFINATNIVVDEDMIEVLNNPSEDILKVMQEVYDIIHEIELEVAIVNYQQLCQLESIEYTKLTLLKAQHLKMIQGDVNKLEEEINDSTKGVD